MDPLKLLNGIALAASLPLHVPQTLRALKMRRSVRALRGLSWSTRLLAGAMTTCWVVVGFDRGLSALWLPGLLDLTLVIALMWMLCTVRPAMSVPSALVATALVSICAVAAWDVSMLKATMPLFEIAGITLNAVAFLPQALLVWRNRHDHDDLQGISILGQGLLVLQLPIWGAVAWVTKDIVVVAPCFVNAPIAAITIWIIMRSRTKNQDHLGDTADAPVAT